MPDRGGSRALLRLCDSVSGANWRPTRFEDELTVLRYACCVCDVVPSTTVVLPCSHVLCELCVTGCVVQDGGSVCPLDIEPFCEDECQKLKLPAKTKHNLKVHCWNEPDGCQFVGTIEDLLLHYDRECAFHAVQCRRCEQRILRRHIASHYVAGCSQNASCASGGEPHRQNGYPTNCDSSVILDKFTTLQRQMNEVLEVCRASDSARLQVISRAVSGFENSLQRGMESIEANICTMVTRQLNAGLEELRASNIDPCSDHLSSLQSQMNELVEQSRQREASQIREIGRVLRDSQIEVKEDVKVQLQGIVHVIRVSESELKETVKTQLKEHIQVMKNSGCELKEHVSRVETNLSSRLADQQQTLQGALDSLKQNCEFAVRKGHLSVAASGKQEEIPFRVKLDMFVNESLTALELQRQQAFKDSKRLWVSSIADCVAHCAMGSNDFRLPGFDVTLENCGNIFNSHSIDDTVANRYYRDMLVQIRFSAGSLSMFWVTLKCLKYSGNSSFSWNTTSLYAFRGSPAVFVPFINSMESNCRDCSSKHISHHNAYFWIDVSKLVEDGFIKDGKLTLRFEFK